MAKVVARTKAKKKKWYPIIAPKIFNEAQMGEAYVADPSELVGRHVSLSLMEVTNNPKMQHINIECQVKEVKGDKAYTFARGFEMSHGAVKRYVRKGRDRVDDSFVLKTKDGFRVRVKPMLVTTNNTSKSVLTRLRNTTKNMLAKEFSGKKYNDLLEEILSSGLQKRLRNELSKIYPVRNFEIRMMHLLDDDRIPEEDKKAPAKKEEKKVEEAERKKKTEKEKEETKEKASKKKESGKEGKSKKKGEKDAGKKSKSKEKKSSKKDSKKSKSSKK